MHLGTLWFLKKLYRTYEELKRPTGGNWFISPTNMLYRTYEELKPSVCKFLNPSSSMLYCTYEELKTSV